MTTFIKLLTMCSVLEGQGFCLSSFNFPVSSLPILAACSSGFGEVVDRAVTEANNVYREFITSEAGAGFNGEVK